MPANYGMAPIRPKAPIRLAVGLVAVQGSDTGNVHGFIVKAICPGKTIYVGTSSTVTAADGHPLADGESLTLEMKNANQLWFISDAGAQAVSILPFYRG